MTRARGEDQDEIPLVDRVVAELRRQMLGQVYAPGDKLPAEGRLAESFGVSRNVIREAMRTLNGEGLVDIAQGRTARVQAPSTDQVTKRLSTLLVNETSISLRHLLDVRRALETEAVVLSCRARTDENLARMQAHVDALARAEPVAERVEVDLGFHMEIARSTQNPLFPMLTTAVLPLFARFISRVTIGDGSARAAVAHQRILEAVATRDAERARREMLNHLDGAEMDLAHAERQGM